MTRSLSIVHLLALAALAASTFAASPEPRLSMSPGLLELYRAEMRELLVGTQAVAVALPTGDWESIVAASEKMKSSYVMEQELTPAQQEEIAGLPEHFNDLDQSFHARSEKLAAAAIDRDSEAAAYQFSRLLETCASCHAVFAQSRFPGFDSKPADAHHH